MKRFIGSAILLLGSAGIFFAQQTTPPAPSSTPSAPQQTQSAQPRQPTYEQQRINQINMRREQEAFNNLRNLSNLAAANSVNVASVMRMNISPRYRKPNKKELEPLEPAESDLQKYSDFLKQKNTGMFVLLPDAGCHDHSNVIVVSPECLEHRFPGGGSSYSFRIENYRLPDLADLNYVDGVLGTPGVLVGRLFVDLGEQTLDSININSPGLKYLIDYPAAKTSLEAFERGQSIMSGIKVDGFSYGLGVFARENSTSAVRLIAYRARHLKYVEGVTYDEFSFDKRRDVIIAFRVIRKDEDGRITILWKELQSKKAPKIKIVSPEDKDASERSKAN
ncbi:MAG: hypothetical protein R2681_02165 [Pyrinomonadaceae bacterium]